MVYIHRMLGAVASAVKQGTCVSLIYFLVMGWWGSSALVFLLCDLHTTPAFDVAS